MKLRKRVAAWELEDAEGERPVRPSVLRRQPRPAREPVLAHSC